MPSTPITPTYSARHVTSRSELILNQKNEPVEFGFRHVYLCCLALFISCCLFKSTAPFAVFFAHDLDMTFQNFALANQMGDFGATLSVFLAPLFKPYSSRSVMSFFLLLGFVSALLSAVRTHFEFPQLFVLRLVFGMSTSLFYTWSTTTVESFFDEKSDKLRAIAMVESSWALGSAGFVVVGIILRYLGWWAVFVILGGAHLPFIFLIYWTFPDSEVEPPVETAAVQNYQSIRDVRSLSTERVSSDVNLFPNDGSPQPSHSYFNDLRVVFTDRRCLLLGATMCLTGLVTGLLYMSMGVYYASIFGLNTAQVGYVTLSVMGGEVTGCFILIFWGDYFPDLPTVLGASCGMTAISFAYFAFSAWLPQGFVTIALSFVLMFSMAICIEIIFARGFYLGIVFAPNKNVGKIACAAIVSLVSAGSTLGGIVAPEIWKWGQWKMTTLTMCCASALSALSVLVIWYEGAPQKRPQMLGA